MANKFDSTDAKDFVSNMQKIQEFKHVSPDLKTNAKELAKSCRQATDAWRSNPGTFVDSDTEGRRIGQLMYGAISADVKDTIIQYYVKQAFILDIMEFKEDQEDANSVALALYDGVLKGFEEMSQRNGDNSNNGFCSRLFDPGQVESYFRNCTVPVVLETEHKRGRRQLSSLEISILRYLKEVDTQWMESAKNEEYPITAGKNYGTLMHVRASVIEAKVKHDTVDDLTVETYFLMKFTDFKREGMNKYTGQQQRIARFYDNAASTFRGLGPVRT